MDARGQAEALGTMSTQQGDTYGTQNYSATTTNHIAPYGHSQVNSC